MSISPARIPCPSAAKDCRKRNLFMILSSRIHVLTEELYYNPCLQNLCWFKQATCSFGKMLVTLTTSACQNRTILLALVSLC